MYLTKDQARIIIEIFGLTSIGFTYRHISIHSTPTNRGYGGNSKLLTIWALTLSTLALFLGLLDGLLLHSFPLVQASYSYIGLLAFALEFMITTSYWGLTWYNPSLIRPPNKWQPSLSLDISLHLSPFLLVVADLLLARPLAIQPSYIALFGSSCFMIFSYGMWNQHCYTQNGWNPYPGLERTKGMARMLLILSFSAVMSLIGYLFARV